MRRSILPLSVLALALAVVVAAAPKHPAASPAGPGDWPDTPAGRAARGWTAAFSKGEPAMRAFLAQSLAPEALARRGLDARLETYRDNHERFGSLMLVSVDSSGTSGIKVTLASSQLSALRFSFFTQEQPPYKLLTVYRTETRSVGHTGFGH
jgi:hypothetical protein